MGSPPAAGARHGRRGRASPGRAGFARGVLSAQLRPDGPGHAASGSRCAPYWIRSGCGEPIRDDPQSRDSWRHIPLPCTTAPKLISRARSLRWYRTRRSSGYTPVPSGTASGREAVLRAKEFQPVRRLQNKGLHPDVHMSSLSCVCMHDHPPKQAPTCSLRCPLLPPSWCLPAESRACHRAL